MSDYTTGHCKNKNQPGGCQLHNLQCGYPSCDRRPTTQPPHQDRGEVDPILAIQTFARAYKAEVPNAELTVHGIDAGLRAVAAMIAAAAKPSGEVNK